MNDLRSELEQLSPSFRNKLEQAGYDQELLISWGKRLGDEKIRSLAETNKRSSNELKTEVHSPKHSVFEKAPSPRSSFYAHFEQLGEESLKRGELAFCVMAGGMATRMGGLVKALVEVLPGLHFLDVILNENQLLHSRYGSLCPLWFMTGFSTDAPIREALDRKGAPHINTFMQNTSLRLTPNGQLFFESDQKNGFVPSTYSTGHGDLIAALNRSGLLESFIAKGGKYVWVANLDNLAASVDPALLGYFISKKMSLMVELCPKEDGDRGGIPVVTQGRVQIVEEYRLPPSFRVDLVPAFNTNTMLFDAKTLRFYDKPSTYFEVWKEVDGRQAVQFERLLQEVTAHIDANYIVIPRAGENSRFLPIKNNADLERHETSLKRLLKKKGLI